MQWPLVLHVALYSLILPIGAALWQRRALSQPMRIVAWWYVVLFIQNWSGILWTMITKKGNLAVSQLFMPIEATLVLLAIAEWQLNPVVRATVRYAIPFYWVAWVFAIGFIEPLGSFSTFAGPLLALLVLGSSLVAFITRLQSDVEPATESDWGYVLPGLAIFFAVNATATIVLAVGLANEDWPLMMNATIVRGWIYLFATLLITWGYLWPTRHHRSSGPSSSPLHSP